jgi:hypothetical protein
LPGLFEFTFKPSASKSPTFTSWPSEERDRFFCLVPSGAEKNGGKMIRVAHGR